MSNVTRGSCVCGAVRFTIAGAARVFQYCHCSRCRKRTGSAHAANLFVAPDQLEWQQGLESVRRFELPAAKSWSNAFCAQCGSALPWLTRSGRAVIVPAGALDDDPGQRPTRNIHFASRASWYEHAASLELHDGEP